MSDKVKLSKAQKEIVKVLQENPSFGILWERANYWSWVGKSPIPLSQPVVNHLKSKEIIEATEPSFYQLTPLGKQITL